MSNRDDEGLKTLEKDGSKPATRMESAVDVQSRVQTFLDADDKQRSRHRALVKGLVDGNPPYRS